MSWKIDYREDDRIIFVKTHGVHTPSEIWQIATEALTVGKKHGTSLFLVDDREMTPEFRTLEIYKLPRDLAGLGLSREAKVAVVFSAASARKEDFEFYETVASNFGNFSTRLFEDSLESALGWLKTGRSK